MPQPAADRAFAAYERSQRGGDRPRRNARPSGGRPGDLHDTVLSTLTIVGLGAVGPYSRALRSRAGGRPPALIDPARVAVADPLSRVALDVRLQGVLDAMPMRVTESLVAVHRAARRRRGDRRQPAAALSTSSARAGRRRLAAPAPCGEHRRGRGIDAGPGFDPGLIPSHRYGLRESSSAGSSFAAPLCRLGARSGHPIRLEWPMRLTERRPGRDRRHDGRARRPAGGDRHRVRVAPVIDLFAILAVWSQFRVPWAAGSAGCSNTVVVCSPPLRVSAGARATTPLIVVLLLVDVLSFAIVPGGHLRARQLGLGDDRWFAVLVLCGRRVSRWSR